MARPWASVSRAGSWITGTLLISLAWASASSGFWSETQSIFIGDHLRPYLQIQTLFNGGLDSVPRFSRLPSLFPDYLDALVTSGLRRDIKQWMFASSILNGAWLSCSGALFVSQITKRSFWRCCLLSSIAIVAIGAWIPQFGAAAGLATMPIHHGGNITATFLAWAWITYQVEKTWRRITTIATICGAALFSFDNLFFLITFLLPLTTLSIANAALNRKKIQATHKNWLRLCLTSTVGCLLGYILLSAVPTECRNSLTANLGILTESIKLHSSLDPKEGSPLLLLCGLAYAASLFTSFRNRESDQATMLLIGSTLGSALTIASLTYISDHRLNSAKYILLPLLISPFLLSTSALFLSAKAWTTRRDISNKLSRVFSITAATILISLCLPAVQASQSLASQWQPKTALLQLNDGQKHFYLVDSSLDPLQIELFSGGSIRTLPIASDGNPWLWHYSKSDLNVALRAGRPEAIIRKTAIEPEFVDRFVQRYGELEITPASSHEGLVSYRFENPSLAMSRLQTLVSRASTIGCDGFQSQPLS